MLQEITESQRAKRTFQLQINYKKSNNYHLWGHFAEYSIYCSTELFNNPVRSVLILSTFYRGRNGGTEWLSNLLEVTQLSGIGIQLGLTPKHLSEISDIICFMEQKLSLKIPINRLFLKTCNGENFLKYSASQKWRSQANKTYSLRSHLKRGEV